MQNDSYGTLYYQSGMGRHATRANPNLGDLPCKCTQRGMPSDTFLQSYTATDPRSVQRSRAEQLRGWSGWGYTFR